MAEEIVGTAFVRIKALTKGLGKEIEKSVKKGMADANLERVGEEEGEKLGTSLGDSTVDSASDRIKKRSGDIVPKDVFDDIRKQINRDGGLFGDFDLFPRNAERETRRDFEKQSEIVRSGMARINENIEKAWPKDRDLLPNFNKMWRDADRDTNNFARSLSKLQSQMNSLGSTNFGGGITKALGGIAGLAVAALPYIQDLGAGILAYATGIVAQIGFMSTAVVGLAAAAGAAIGSALLPILPIMLAFKSETEALVEFKDALKATGEEFLRIGTATQATLLPGLDRAAFRLTELVPMLSEFGFFVGHAVANFADLAANILTSEVAQGRLSDILRSSLRIFDVLLVTLVNVGDILSGLWVAAIPASERFVGSLSAMVNRWREIINFGLYTGTLTETLDTWYDRAELLGSALGNVFGALWDILSIGADSSDSVFVRFDEWAERFREWTESEVGRNRLALIFDNSLAIMREVNAVAVELFDGIFGRLDDIGGADSMVESLQRFQELLPGIKATMQDFVDQIREVNSIIGPQLKNKILQAFNELKEPLGRLVFAIIDIMNAMEESGAFETFLDLLKILAETLTTVLSIPGFGTFVGYMIAFGGAAKVASIALGPLVAVMTPFVGVIKAIAAARAGTALATTATGLTSLATAGKGAGGLGSLLKTVGGGLLPMGPWGLAAGAGLAAVGGAFFLATKDSREFKQEVRQLSDALGTLNGGLNIATEGIAAYIQEESRFESRNQLDDLERLGFSYEGLATKVAQGTFTYADFADAALNAGEVTAAAFESYGAGGFEVDNVASSMEGLRDQFNLTDEQLRKLATGAEVYTDDGVLVMLDGNSDLLESFKELNEVIGAAAKESIDDFALNEQNIRLLGETEVSRISRDIREADDEEAGQKMINVLARLREEAVRDSAAVTGLSDAMRDQIRTQATLADGTVDVIRENALLRQEQEKLFTQIRDSFTLFNSTDFKVQFGEARREVIEFSNVVRDMNWDDFNFVAAFGDLDDLRTSFPEIGGAASELFESLRGLPQEEFNAAAQVMNADAESLRDAMNGAQQAIIDLQETALSKLPSIQAALDENLKTKEDGTQYFDVTGFTQSATDRINKTNDFASDIEAIFKESGAEAARLALEQGPETANALAEALATNPTQVEELLTKMENAENSLTAKVKELFGETLAAEYFATVKPAGDAIGIGLTAGLTDPTVMQALNTGGDAVMDNLVRGFKGKFVWTDAGELQFVKTGTFKTAQTQLYRLPTTGGGGLTFSDGGFVNGPGSFFGSPSGTDTVPAWLTPGEFVLRKTVAQAVPASVLNSLNAGDPRLISLLTSLNQRRPGGPAAAGTLGNIPPAPAARGGSGNVIIQQMNIEAPTPYETSRQVTNRLRILQTQIGQG